MARRGGKDLVSPIHDYFGTMTAALYLNYYVRFRRFTIKQMIHLLKVVFDMGAKSRCNFNVTSREIKSHNYPPVFSNAKYASNAEGLVKLSNHRSALTPAGNVKLVAIF